MTTTNTTLDKATRDAQWTEHYGLALFVAREKLRYEDGSLPPAWRELRDEAMGHAWMVYERTCVNHPDWPAKSRVAAAARIGVLRARSGKRMVKTHEQGYVDAMDGRVGREAFFDATAPAPTGYRDPSDRTSVESMIDQLPKELQPVARLFSYGHTKDKVAELRNVSRSTVYNLVQELRKLVPAILPEPKPVETEPEPVRRFCPAWVPVMAIDPDYEHNRCLTGAYVYVVDEKYLIIADWPV